MWIFLGIVSFTIFFGYALWSKLTWAMSWQGEKGYLLTASNQPYKFKDTTYKKFRNFFFAVPCGPGVSLRIHRESRWDRFAKKIGLSCEYQFNDPEFDDELYVVSNAPAFRAELAETTALRYVLRLLFRDKRLQYIECHEQHVVARYRQVLWSGAVAAPNANEVKQVVAALHGLAESLKVAKLKTKSSWDVYQFRATLLAALATAFLMLGILVLYRVFGFERAQQIMLDLGGLLAFSTFCAGVVLFVLMTATVALLRGCSYAHVILAEVIISGGLGLVLVSYFVVRDINVSFDQSVQRKVEAKVAAKRTWKSKFSTHYDLYLSGLDGSRSLPDKVEVSSDTYCKAQLGKPVTLAVRDGALGYRWIEGYNFY
jgi:hypothetical protein